MLLLFLLTDPVAQSQPDVVTIQAEAAYLRGDFVEALRLYQQLESAGLHDVGLYYNLGLSAAALGDMGSAMLYYRRAYALAPRDPDVVTELARLRTQRTDLLGEDRNPLDGVAVFTAGIVTTDELFAITWTAWLVVCVLAIVLLMDRRRAVMRFLVGLAVLWFVNCGLLLLGRVYVETERPAAVVVAQRATVMSGPDMAYLELYALHVAAELRLLETRGGWVRFILPDGRQGWLPRDVIAVV
jgi:tetratricopeptide (TPR) repeat protein